MKRILLLSLLLMSYPFSLLAQEKQIPIKAPLPHFEWNKRIQKAELIKSEFHRSLSGFAEGVNPEFSPNARVGLNLDRGIQFGFLVNF